MTPVARRFDGLAWRRVAGVEVPVAGRFSIRALGLAHLCRADAGPGLLIPGCRCVHTFGMRFELDLLFLDQAGRVIRCARAVPRRRVLFERRANAVLELPAGLV